MAFMIGHILSYTSTSQSLTMVVPKISLTKNHTGGMDECSLIAALLQLDVHGTRENDTFPKYEIKNVQNQGFKDPCQNYEPITKNKIKY